MKYTVVEYIHILTGMITFFVGPVQFVPYVRNHAIKLHRLLGKAYIISVFISSPTGFILSFKTPLMLAAIGTAFQSILWFLFTLWAYLNIRKKNIIQHQAWMFRSYALVLAAPIVRVYIFILEEWIGVNFKQHFDFYYPLFVWLSFLPLIIVELCIQCTRSVKEEHQ